MLQHRKANFTLLEVLIALGLTLLILTTLLSAYLNAERTSLWWQKEEKEQFTLRFFTHRLTEVFNHLAEIDQNKSFFLTTESGLIFSYDNGASFDRLFSGPVLGRLFIDPRGDLYLITWPEKELWGDSGIPPFHREVLMKGVASMQLSFLNKDENGLSWKSGGYSKEIKELPAAIKMTLTTKEGKQHTFYFPIPGVLSYLEEKQ